MNDFFIDLFEFQHHFNTKTIALFAREGERISPKSISLLSHILNAHQIWNARILDEPTLNVNDLHTVDECGVLEDSNYQTTLKILRPNALTDSVSYKNSKGDQFTQSLNEILFHIVNHTTHHRGQIMLDLRQHGIEPIATDYIHYKSGLLK